MDCHILQVAFPAQGHINPSLQFARRLVKLGIKITFLTSRFAIDRITKNASNQEGITFVSFSHGYEDVSEWSYDVQHFMSTLRSCGSEAVAELIRARAAEGRPFAHVIYATLIPWAGTIAHSLDTPSTLLWIQPAGLLDIYYYYFNGFQDLIKNAMKDPISLPGLPCLTVRDLPSFLLSSSPDIYGFALLCMKEHVELVEKETNSRVLVNTFDALEAEALRAIGKVNLIAIGPLIPSAFLDGSDPSDTSFGGDLLQKSENYIEWLNSKANSSVVYVAFGSYSQIPKQQMEEIARGLLESRRPFLWVIRAGQNGEKEEEKIISCMEELEKQGMIVPWCSQVEVLSHSSLGCFLTHCGWNSSLESLVSGVPVVAFPLWTDQTTNAKFIEDVWKTGVRVRANEDGIVEAAEIERCLEIVMGEERGEEFRNNARKWKNLAKEAAKENGTSYVNLKAFVEEIRNGWVK